ncbi:MAG TPA: LacI family DNA-binding transcriptional regulator [Tepidisphaeraceae bacterium]|nr:LacI family DNA-binding transcriptional regulator [Tepidisphaeraceae bacterium]
MSDTTLPRSTSRVIAAKATEPGEPRSTSRRTFDDARKPISLRDVAAEAKVSVATVSMVLNDNPRISRATHLRISRIIERMGYQPNRLAQSLSSRYTRVLGVMLPALRHAFADAYFGELISGICDRAGKMGFKIMLEQAKPEFVKERKHIHIFERRYVDGLLVLGMNDRHHFLEDFADGRYPLCVVDNKFNQWKLDHAVCDYAGGAEQVMNYLLQLGHRHIGCIYAAPEIQTAADVLHVYRKRLGDSGHEVDDSWAQDGRFTDEGGAAAAAALLKRHPEITALFCGNDKMAIGAQHYLANAGIRVPEEVSVVGFDNMQNAAFVTPSLTTVHLPLYQVGALACERLIDRVRGRAERVAEVLPTHLVVRNSTAMARQS